MSPDYQLPLLACEYCGTFMVKAGRFCSGRCSSRAYYYRNRPAILQDRKERYRDDPDYRNKIAIHRIAAEVVPQMGTCAHCAQPAVDRHHPDDSRPTEVIHLCRSCHAKVHAPDRGPRRKRQGVSDHAT